jgi:hypothetical protein
MLGLLDIIHKKASYYTNGQNEIADDYHLIFADWIQSILQQAEILDQVIQSKLTYSTTRAVSLLDCSCGIGTQAIGMASS